MKNIMSQLMKQKFQNMMFTVRIKRNKITDYLPNAFYKGKKEAKKDKNIQKLMLNWNK